jgi:hypothetical protein
VSDDDIAVLEHVSDKPKQKAEKIETKAQAEKSDKDQSKKTAKEEGKKQKEAQAAAEVAMGLTAEQTTVYKETEAMLAKVRVEIGKMMTPEQMAKLPEQAQAAFKEKTGKGKKAS